MNTRERHLGELTAALIDGVLDHDTRDWALGHVAGCAGCRAEVDAQRWLKARLVGLVDPEPPPALYARLRELTGRTLTGGADGPPGAAMPWRTPKRIGARPPGRPVGRISGIRAHVRPWRLLAEGVLAVVVVGLLLAALGPGPASPAPIRPRVGDYTVEHASTVTGFPGADPAGDAIATVSMNR